MSISTAVDPSAVARVVGIKSTFKNLRRNGVAILPQRVAVFGQGNSASVFSSAKRQVTSALEAGQVYGFGSPIHLAVMQLLPANGDGVGTIPVTVYPLDDGAVAAEGDITPSGTQVTSASYRVNVNGMLTPEFTVLAGASVTTINRSIQEAIAAAINLPILATFEYGTVTRVAGTNTGNGTCTAMSVTGTPKPGAYVFKCTATATNGGVFSLTDPDGTVLTGSTTLTPGAATATVVSRNGLQFTITDGSTDFAVNDLFTITVPALWVVTAAKWAGVSGNDLYVAVEGSTTAGVSYAITQPVGGLTDPTVDDALDQMGNVWETLVLNCLAISNDTALDTYSTFGGGRYGALVRKPLVVLTGTTEADLTTATEIPEARLTDRVNGQLVAPGSVSLPWVVAARQLMRIAVMANANPAHDYGSQRATGIEPGLDSEQWNYTQRNVAVSAGSSTVEVVDGVVYLGDIVTFYHPSGDLTPAYRFVVDIVKLQNIVFNIDSIFDVPEWDGAPLIPDDQPTTNRSAKKPKAAVAAVCGMIDSLSLEALISDPKTAKASVIAEIDENNPKRLNLTFDAALSGNTNIKSIDFNFGFYFGTPSIVS